MERIIAEGLARIAENDAAAAPFLLPRLGEAAALLERHVEEIALFNPALGLTGTKDRREIGIRHVLDSLAPLGTIAGILGAGKGGGAGFAADVGSGAGFPGLPLAVCLPETRFVLIERMGRRAGFLRNVTAVLGLSNVDIEETEMEKAAPGRFDAVLFRAFRPLESGVFRSLARLAAPSGVLAAWKGRRENAEAELRGLSEMTRDFRTEILPVRVPFLEEERCLVLTGKRQLS